MAVVAFIILLAGSLFTVSAKQEAIFQQAQNHPGTSTIEGILALASSAIAIFLFVVSAIAFKKDRRTRFLFVSAAFLLFAVKEAMFATSEMILPVESVAIEAFSVLIDFAVLALFFVGLIKK